MAEFKILVPLDGSKLAEHALAYLRFLKQMGEPRVLLLAASDEPEGSRGDRERNMLSSYLNEVAADLQKHFGLEVETRLGQGDAASVILREAGTFAPDILIIATHGRSGLSRWRFGSVADKVIRGSVSDTLVIGPKATEREAWLVTDVIPAFKDILVPVDGSELGEAALALAVRMAAVFDSKLHVVRVVPIPTMGDGYAGEATYRVDMTDSMMDAARTYVAEAVARHGIADRAKTEVIMGPVAAQLETYVIENKVDLVIMTSHGRSGIIRTALGSVTDRLLGGPAPILVVRSREPASA